MCPGSWSWGRVGAGISHRAEPLTIVELHYVSFGSLPAPAESVVELHQREPFVELCLRKIELRRQVVVFTYQHLQVTRSAILVKYLRETIGIFRRRSQ